MVIGCYSGAGGRVASIVARHERAFVLIVNTDNACVIGGERTAVRAVAAEVGSAFHPLNGGDHSALPGSETGVKSLSRSP